MHTTVNMSAIGGVVDPPIAPSPDIAGLFEYHADLLTSFGINVDEERWRSGPFRNYHRLIDELLKNGVDCVPPPDLIVVSYALPDVHPFKTTASYLNWLHGNRARSFAVSEQGLLAPFSALRIVAAYREIGICRHALLAVLEQTTLAHDDPVVHDGDQALLSDSGVLLTLGDEGERELRLSVSRPGGGPEDLAAALIGDDATVLVTSKRATVPSGIAADVIYTGTNNYCTGVWLALVHNWKEWQHRYDRVVLHDVDPRTHKSGTAVLRWTA